MKARRTHNSDRVFRLPGGNEDNDLWTYNQDDPGGNATICSVWVPTDAEREAIMRGENIRLIVWGSQLPPVAVDLTDEPLGKNPHSG